MDRIRIETRDAEGRVVEMRAVVNGSEVEYLESLLIAVSPGVTGCLALGVPRGGRLEIGAAE